MPVDYSKPGAHQLMKNADMDAAANVAKYFNPQSSPSPAPQEDDEDSKPSMFEKLKSMLTGE